MAAARIMTDPQIVSLLFHHLSDMKYKDRQQHGSDEPVEFLQFRPTLIPSICVNKLWADEGTSILWKQYPHTPALRNMSPSRRQWYANKIEELFVVETGAAGESFSYLDDLSWPKLKLLELDVDWRKSGKSLANMLHADLETLEFLGPQTGDSNYVASIVLPALFRPCARLRSITLGPDVINHADPIEGHVLTDLLKIVPSINEIYVMSTAFLRKDRIFADLSVRPGLRALEINLEPNSDPQPYCVGTSTLIFRFIALRRLHIACFPEIALALPKHLYAVEEISLDIASAPNAIFKIGDKSAFDKILHGLSQCHSLKRIRVNVGRLTPGFPSASSLPILTGTALLQLAVGCTKLQNLKLLSSEPAAIDASNITSSQFELFCQKMPHLIKLDLKLHPQTAVDLESSALQSLARNCTWLEFLRLKIALQLPNLNLTQSHGDNVPPKGTGQNNAGSSASANQPIFPHLTHLAFARPQTILSIMSDTYTVCSSSQSSATHDPLVEDELVRSWAHPLSTQCPRLEILEAWGDWIGDDNESITYFLPLEEVLATTWEFLSGVEQDLWDDEESVAVSVDWAEDAESRLSFGSSQSGDDWDRASLINEYPFRSDLGDSESLSGYDEEPEDMITPGRTVDVEEDPFSQAC